MSLFVPIKIVSLRLLVAAAMAGFMLACGGGSGSPESTASSAVTFQVVWDRTEKQPADFQRAGLSDCDDVDTVTAAVYTRDNQLLGEGGPWSCGNGSGVIGRLPAYRYAKISVEGRGAEGLPLYRGQSTRPFYLVPGRVDGGLIVASSLVPSLVSPADLGVVNPNVLELQWTPVKAATGYRVMIATSTASNPLRSSKSLTAPARASGPTGSLMKTSPIIGAFRLCQAKTVPALRRPSAGSGSTPAPS